jgi:hypothetical protein
MRRDQVFISYSHHDRKWVEELVVTLAPLLRKRTIVVWDDSKIRVGNKWKAEIEAALSKAKVAVLLVSRQFLASEFIQSNELPPLLEAAEKDGLIIFWIAIGHSLYEQTEITDFQAANDPSRPLNSLSESETDRELVRIAKLLDSVLTSSRQDEKPEPSAVDSAKSTPLESEDAGTEHVETDEAAASWTAEPMTGKLLFSIGVNAEDLAKALGQEKVDDEQMLAVRQRLLEELSNGRWAWRSTYALSGKAGVDEKTTLAILRADPEVELGRSKSGRVIARMRRAEA